ncbi:MAG: hypothetical protein AB2598_18995 [Candidatus Thiodiazotropha sp.]
MNKIYTLLFIIFEILRNFVYAQDADPRYINYHPNSTLTIGAGYVPNDLSLSFPGCISTLSTPMEMGALSTSITSYIVTSKSRIEEAFGIDAKLSASYLTFSGNSNYSKSSNYITENNSVTVVITAKTEFGRIGFPQGAALTPEANNLLNKPDEFIKKCGSRFVTIERRGALVSVVIQIHGVSDEIKETITAGANASGGIGQLSGSASVNIKSEIQKASFMGRVTVNVLASGGEGLGSFSDSIKAVLSAKDNLEAISSGLADFMKSFKTENSVPIGFHTASMEVMGVDLKNFDFWTDFHERSLRKLADEYRKILRARDKAESIKNKENIWHRLVTENEAKVISEGLQYFDIALANLASAHKSCKQAAIVEETTCIIPEKSSNLKNILNVLPDYPRLPSGTFRFAIWRDHEIKHEMFGHFESRPFVYELSGKYNLLKHAKDVYSDATKAAIYFKVEGDGLLSCNLVFRDNNTDLSSIVKSYNCGPSDTLILAQHDSRQETQTISRLVTNYIFMKNGEHSGVFSLSIHDKYGRNTYLDVVKASWKRQSNISTIKTNYVMY